MKNPFGYINWSDVNWSGVSTSAANLIAEKQGDLKGDKGREAVVSILAGVAGCAAAALTEVIVAPIPVLDVVLAPIVGYGVNRGIKKLLTRDDTLSRPAAVSHRIQGEPSLRPA